VRQTSLKQNQKHQSKTKTKPKKQTEKPASPTQKKNLAEENKPILNH